MNFYDSRNADVDGRMVSPMQRKLEVALSVFEGALAVIILARIAQPLLKEALSGGGFLIAVANNLEQVAGLLMIPTALIFSVVYIRGTPTARMICTVIDRIRSLPPRATNAVNQTPNTRRVGALEDLTSLQTYVELTYRSRRLQERMINQSTLYLAVASALAFFGIISFYATVSNISKPANLEEYLFAMLPKGAMLFFIEFIAVLFLGLHRHALRNYRELEAVTRRREEALTILKLRSEAGSASFDPTAVSFLLTQSENIVRSGVDETDHHEVALIRSVAEVVGAARGNQVS
jgi:hypothetical protein